MDEKQFSDEENISPIQDDETIQSISEITKNIMESQQFDLADNPPQEKQPFDLSILDDVELDTPPAESADSQDVGDDISQNKAEELPIDILVHPKRKTLIPRPDVTKLFNQELEFDKDETQDNLFEETQTEETPVQENTPAVQRKGRPKHKKGEGLFGIPNILVTLVWVALTFLIGVTAGRMIWICATDVLAFGREDKAVTVTIYESDSIEQITDKLYRAGLIKYRDLFKLYAKFAVDDGEIHPGMWDLNTKYDYHALVKMMSPSSSREVIKVLIPEGYTCRQIFALLEDSKVCTAQDIADYAASGELDEYWFLDGIQRGDKYCLEGFLFPDTYEFYKNDSPKNVIHKMLNNFDNRFDEEMRWQIDQLNGRLADTMRANGKDESYIANHLFSIRDIVNVASMVEKETSSAQESFTIASVIYNRLFDWGGTPAYLNIDATIVYALEGKNDLTAEDLRVDSPYNTYTNTGLTPGPISNPGLSSLKAALDPAQTDYYFYVLDPAQGSHHFSRTQEEHEAFRDTLR